MKALVRVAVGALISMACLLPWTTARAQQSHWVRTNGPEGGDIPDLLRTANGHLYAAVAGAGVFRSTDGAESWESRNTGMGNRSVSSLAVTNAGTLLAGTGSGLYRSTDGSASWTAGNNGLTNKDVEDVVVTSGGTVYLATWGAGVFLSTDDGVSWSPAGTTTATMSVYFIEKNAADHLFIGTFGMGSYRSTDGGATWQALGLSGYVYNIGESSSGVLFGGAHMGGLKKSMDSGRTWTVCDNGLPRNGSVTALAFPAPGTVLVSIIGKDTTLFRSTDDGVTWLPFNTGFGPSYAVSCLVAPSGDLYLGMQGDGVWRRRTTETAWAKSSTGLRAMIVYTVATTPDGTVLAGCYGGTFRSSNGGTDWESSYAGITHNLTYELLSAGGQDVYAAVSGGGVFRSTDGGRNWALRNNGMNTTRVNCLSLDSSGTLWAGSTDSATHCSTDQGAHWERRANGLTTQSISTMLCGAGNVVYAGTNSAGIFKSTNRGADWAEVNAGLTVTDVSALAMQGSILFAGTGSGAFRSTDGAASWTKITADFETKYVSSFHALKSGALFAGTEIGVFRSTDAGLTWAPWNDDLTNLDVECLGSDREGNLLAGADFGGVFRYTFPPTNPEITIGTNPAGLSFTADGSTYTASQHFTWQSGSVHQIGTTSPQSGTSGVRYTWSSWSFGYPMTFSYTAVAGSSATLTASFGTEYELTMNAGPGGTVTPGTGWSKSGAQVQINAVPSAGYAFDRWEGSGASSYSGPTNPVNLTLAGPVTETAYFRPVTEVEERTVLPSLMELYTAAPNPASARTTIAFALPRAQTISLAITNLLGRECARPLHAVSMGAGKHRVSFDASNLAPGIYLYRLESNAGTMSRRLAVVR